MCEKATDGKFFENPSDCGSPYCHSTYVVCYNGAPTVQHCPEDTVWSQARNVCIERAEAPGSCSVRGCPPPPVRSDLHVSVAALFEALLGLRCWCWGGAAISPRPGPPTVAALGGRP